MQKRQAVASVKLDGWKRTTGKGRRTGREKWTIETEWAGEPIVGPWVMLENEDEKIVLLFNFSNYDQDISGHIHFENDGSWYTFDQCGIDDSFHATWSDKPKSYEKPLAVDAIVADALERVGKSRARGGQAEVPGLPGISIRKTRRDEIERLLRKGVDVDLTPAGMGVGYRLGTTTRRTTPFGWKRAEAKTAKFFGLDRLFVESFDHD